MRDRFLPFCRPDITDADVAAVTDVLRSGWLTTGARCREFEETFCRYTGADGAVAVASATGGMHLVLKALGIGPGDEVITSSLTWVSTVNLIVLSGATPVFADVDRDTLMMTPATAAPCFSERTRCLIPVHFAGAALDLPGFRELTEAQNVPLIEDAAHAVGTAVAGERIGGAGTAIFSFHPIKNMTTGEGGMICSDNAELLERLRRLRFHGLGADAYDRQVQGRAPQAQVLEPGFKYNLTDLAAALGLSQLARLDANNAKRRLLTAYYQERLAEVDEILPLADPAYPCTHARHLLVVRLDIDRAGLDRDTFMEELKARNIGSGLHFRPVHTHAFYRRNFSENRVPLPQTEWNGARICSLPLFPGMTEADVDDVIAAIKEILRKGRK